MKFDEYGQPLIDSAGLVKYLHTNPNLDISQLVVIDPDQYNSSIDELCLDLPHLKKYIRPNVNLYEFDRECQSRWFMPVYYQNMDIAKWVLEQCTNDYELQRVGEELLLFQERNLFPLLCYLKYLVDTMRENSVVWGVGRGSSVASYVLYLIGVHRINSLEFDLDIREFLKD